MSEVAERDKVLALQEELKHFPQVECPTFHHFCDGMYAREFHCPKDVVAVGKIHKRAGFFAVMSGTMLVTTNDVPRVMKAGEFIITQPGTKRAVFGIEDSVCVTFHRVDSGTDMAAIEKELIEFEPGAMLDYDNKVKPLEIESCHGDMLP